MRVVGQSTAEVLHKAKELVLAKGEKIAGQRGEVCSLKSVDLILENPFENNDPYPFWDQASTKWYLSFFVDKLDQSLPEKPASKAEYITPYNYAQRSRFYDFGFGYTLGFCRAVQKLGLSLNQLTNKDDLNKFLIQIGQLVHIQRALSVLHWWGRGLLNHWLKESGVLKAILDRTRRDTLLDVIRQLELSPVTRRAITPSFIYPNIDLSLPAGGIPPYQSYQLFQDGQGITSIHLHRAIDVRGGAQLDLAHDLSWGRLASEKLGQPLVKIIIRVNDLWFPLGGEVAKASDIKTWLWSVVDGYPATKKGVREELVKPKYLKSVKMVVEKLTRARV